MKYDDLKKQFYKNHMADIQEVKLNKIFYLIEKAVKTNNKKLISYEKMISIGKENELNEKINQNDYNELLFNVYKTWYNNWLKKQKEDKNTYIGEKIQAILNDKTLNPNTYKKEVRNDILEIMNFIDPEKFFNNAWYFQSGHFVLFNVKDFYANKGKKMTCDARLYLNIKQQNIAKLANLFIEDAIKNDLPLLFKFALKGNRNDNMVFYVQFAEFDEIVDMIERTKKNYPELFEGCKVKNPIMATYKKYMGYGEEPLSFGSYTSNRVEIFEYMFGELSKDYKKDKNSLTKENMNKYFLEGCKFDCIDPKEFYKNVELRKIHDEINEK